MNPTIWRIELTRFARDWAGLLFIVGIPALMYVIFGASTAYKDASAGRGNVAMYVMISMAVYGAVTATTGIGASTAAERAQGWGRQLGLTPLRDGSFIAMKATVAVIIALLPIAAIFVLGALSGARAVWWVWALSAFAALLGAAAFTVYGLVFGLLLRSESAASVASGSLVILAFFGNVFIPLNGWLLSVARFTPLYGLIQLVRNPLTEGHVLTGDTLTPESLWIPIANVAVWLTILSVVAVRLVRHSRGRL